MASPRKLKIFAQQNSPVVASVAGKIFVSNKTIPKSKHGSSSKELSEKDKNEVNKGMKI